MNFIARGEGSYDQRFDVVSQADNEVVLANRGDGPLRSLTWTINDYLVDVQAELPMPAGKSDSNGRPTAPTTKRASTSSDRKAASTTVSKGAARTT